MTDIEKRRLFTPVKKVWLGTEISLKCYNGENGKNMVFAPFYWNGRKVFMMKGILLNRKRVEDGVTLIVLNSATSRKCEIFLNKNVRYEDTSVEIFPVDRDKLAILRRDILEVKGRKIQVDFDIYPGFEDAYKIWCVCQSGGEPFLFFNQKPEKNSKGVWVSANCELHYPKIIDEISLRIHMMDAFSHEEPEEFFLRRVPSFHIIKDALRVRMESVVVIKYREVQYTERYSRLEIVDFPSPEESGDGVLKTVGKMIERSAMISEFSMILEDKEGKKTRFHSDDPNIRVKVVLKKGER